MKMCQGQDVTLSRYNKVLRNRKLCSLYGSLSSLSPVQAMSSNYGMVYILGVLSGQEPGEVAMLLCPCLFPILFRLLSA